jgi:hypothetical protein
MKVCGIGNGRAHDIALHPRTTPELEDIFRASGISLFFHAKQMAPMGKIVRQRTRHSMQNAIIKWRYIMQDAQEPDTPVAHTGP